VNQPPTHSGADDGRLSAAALDVLLGELERLPSSPDVASALVALCGRDAGDGELLAALSLDPALVAAMLARAGGDTCRIDEAAARIGRAGLLSLALSAATDEAPGGEIDPRDLWLHCLAVACAAEMIAPVLGLDGRAAYACGLLHDLGKMALRQCLPKSHARAVQVAVAAEADLTQCERQVIGVDHCAAGRRLAQQWRLPREVATVAWLHHNPLQTLPPDLPQRALIGAVGLADMLARRAEIGSSGNPAYAATAEEYAAALALPAEVVADVSAHLEAQVAKRMAPLAGASAGAAQSHAASAQLARLNARLLEQSRQLQSQAAALVGLRDLLSALGPDSTIRDALSGVAAALATAVGTGPVACYSLDAQGGPSLLLRRDGDAAAWRTTAGPACARPPASDRGDEAAEAIWPQDVELRAWLPPAGIHQPLVCQGQWIGGFFCAAPGAAGQQEALAALAAAAASALAIVQGRAGAVTLSEQLAGASQALAAAQQALAQTRTMAAIGEFAAGAAHELNNPLAVVSGRAQLMLRRAASDEERNIWSLMVEQSQRISDIITDLMQFASPPSPKPSAVGARKLLESAAEAFAKSGHPQAATAKVDIEIADSTPAVWADPSQVRDVLVELMTNAATAATERAEIRLRAFAQGREVALVVQDSGPGMDAATLEAAFTPFFSSQKAGRRRGLGLPRARRFVEINGGRIRLSSTSGRATVATVLLPGASEAQERADEQS
jgi:putative nucleotidyltransferase with HDIG domain